MKLDDITHTMRDEGAKALVPFFTAGYPDEQTFLRLLDGAAQAGCRLIEVGVPFSDPIADGPVIQASSQEALAGGMTLNRSLELCAEASQRTGAGLVMMGYINPVLRMGLETFASRAAKSGVVGVIIPDVPLEESPDIRRTLAEAGLTLIDLVAPTSGPERTARIAAVAAGFLYLVSVTGVTGSQVEFGRALAAFGAEVRQHSDLPLYVGFGVSNRDQARQICSWADGVIIGSALIRLVQTATDNDEAVATVAEFLTDINRALNPVGGEVAQ